MKSKSACTKKPSRQKPPQLVVSSCAAENHFQQAVRFLETASQINDDVESRLETITCGRNQAEAAMKSSPPDEKESYTEKVFKLATAKSICDRAKLGLVDAILSTKPTSAMETECLRVSVQVLAAIVANDGASIERRIHASRVARNQLSYLKRNARSEEDASDYSLRLAEICESTFFGHVLCSSDAHPCYYPQAATMNCLAVSRSAAIQQASQFCRPGSHFVLVRRLEDTLATQNEIRRVLEILTGTTTQPFTTVLHEFGSALCDSSIKIESLLNVDKCCTEKIRSIVEEYGYVANTGHRIKPSASAVFLTNYGVLEDAKDFNDPSCPTNLINTNTNPCMLKAIRMVTSVARGAGKSCSKDEVLERLVMMDANPVLYDKHDFESGIEPSKFRRTVCERHGDDFILQKFRIIAQTLSRSIQANERTVILTLSSKVGKTFFSCGSDAAMTSLVEIPRSTVHPQAVMSGSIVHFKPSQSMRFDMSLVTASSVIASLVPTYGDLSSWESGTKLKLPEEIQRDREEHAQMMKSVLEKNREDCRQLSAFVGAAIDNGADELDLLAMVDKIDTPKQTLFRMLKSRFASSDREAVLREIKRIWETPEERVEAIEAVDNDRGTIMKLYLRDIASSDLLKNTFQTVQNILDTNADANIETLISKVTALDSNITRQRSEHPHLTALGVKFGFDKAPEHFKALVSIVGSVERLLDRQGPNLKALDVAKLLLSLKDRDGTRLYPSDTLISDLAFFGGNSKSHEYKKAEVKRELRHSQTYPVEFKEVFGVAQTFWTIEPIEPRTRDDAAEARKQFSRETPLLKYLLTKVIPTEKGKHFAVSLITAVLCRRPR